MRRLVVFLSFSSGDMGFIRALLDRLSAQPVSVWDYSDDTQEIPGGRSIPASLGKRVGDATYFIIVVTRNSLRSEWTQMELRCALELGRLRAGRVLPLVCSECLPPDQWPGPFEELAACRYRTVDPASPMSLEEALQLLCADMHVDYVPPPPQEPRLLLVERLDRELQGRGARRQEREASTYLRLMRVRNEFLFAYEKGEMEAALRHVRLLTALCEHDFPGVRPYYPSLLQALCEMRMEDLDAAERTLRCLDGHASQDESWYAAMGAVQGRRGRYAEAAGLYTEAVRRFEHDPAARAGQIIYSLLAGCSDVDPDEALAEFERGGAVLFDGDGPRLRATRAFVLAQAGRHEEAADVFSDLLVDGELPPNLTTYLADCMCQLGRIDEALDTLESGYRTTGDPVLLHWRARLLVTVACYQQALPLFDELIAECPQERQYRVEKAQVLWALGRQREARAACAPVLDRRQFPLPASAPDFYYDGFAQWLTGERDRAEYDLERSGRPPDQSYDRVMGAVPR